MAQLMPLPLTISCSSKSRFVSPVFYQLTRVVLDKGPLNEVVVVVVVVDVSGSTLCLKKEYLPTTNDNFNSVCPIPVIFGTNITE